MTWRRTKMLLVRTIWHSSPHEEYYWYSFSPDVRQSACRRQTGGTRPSCKRVLRPAKSACLLPLVAAASSAGVFDGEILARMTPIASGLKLSIPKQHAAVLAAGAPSNHQCHSKICGPKEASWRAKDSARAWTGAITMPGHLPLKCSFAWSSVLPIVKGTKCSTG